MILNVLRSLAQSPAPWMVLAGIFVGATLARLARRARPGRHPEHERTRKWVTACLLLSVAVICAAVSPGFSAALNRSLAPPQTI